MATTATTQTGNRPCSLCSRTHAQQPESDRLSWVGHCDRHSVPIVALKRHSGSPSAQEWRHLEVRAKKSFPEYRWQRPLTFDRHFYLHATGPSIRCNVDHAVAA